MAQDNPYVGPRPFTEEEERFFFGRADEVEVLTSLVVTRQASLLFAQSGAGKSSLLMAGLTPRLLRHVKVVRDREIQEPLVSGIHIARVGKGVEELHPANIFVHSVAVSLSSGDAGAIPADITLEGIVTGLLPAVNDDPDAPALPLLMVFDQFEELFTRHLAKRHHRADFFSQINAALKTHPALRMLFSMREDYIAELTPFAHLLPDQLRPRFRLERLGTTAALEAVRKPAAIAVTPRPFAAGVAEELCSNLQAGGAGDIEAILLQVVSKRLWDNLAADAREIGSDDLNNVGNVDDALRAYYDDVVATVVRTLARTASPVTERRVRRFFSEQLLTPGRTRSLVFRDDNRGTTGGLPNEAIEVLSSPSVNLIRSEVRSGGRWYELSHDRMIAPVLASNEAWEQANVTYLQKHAQAWSRTRRSEDLLGAMELQDIEGEIAGDRDELTPIEEEYLERSRQAIASASASLRLNVGELGWAVIFADDDPDRDGITQALTPLFEHRRSQVAERFTRFEFDVKAGETAQNFLARHGAPGGTATAAEPMPYYLLIVGSPARIPFEFQYALDAHYAVGRLDFEGATNVDTRLMFARYARSVVSAESGDWAHLREAVVFNPMPAGDRASTVLHSALVEPMTKQLKLDVALEAWETSSIDKESATRDRLLRLLGGNDRPALLVCAGHGMSWSPEQEQRQRDEQGAIVCSDWTIGTPVIPSAYVAASDIGDSANVLGMIVFLAVTYGAGTPQYSIPLNGERREQARRPFVSKLAQRLLSHPNGAALAVIANVDTFWTSIFDQFDDSKGERRWRSEGPATWIATISRLMRGHTAGSAMEPFNIRYMQAASDLVDSILSGSTPTDRATNLLMLDAVSVRNYIVLGDPAVRLPVDGPIPDQRPVVHVDAPPAKDVDPLPPETLEKEWGAFNMRVKRGIAASAPAPFAGRGPASSRSEEPPPDPGGPPMAVFNGIALSGDYAYQRIPLEQLANTVLGRRSAWSDRLDDWFGVDDLSRPSGDL